MHITAHHVTFISLTFCLTQIKQESTVVGCLGKNVYSPTIWQKRP